MIPVEKEVQIHKMVMAGTPTAEIASLMEVSDSTVKRIKMAIAMSADVPEEKLARVRLLTTVGIGHEAISARMKMPVEVVRAIRRAQLLVSSYTKNPPACPTCGQVILPKEERGEHETTEIPRHIDAIHAAELFVLADDVIGLAKANTVRNVLFYDIADRAERLLETLTGVKDAEESD